MKSIFNIYNTGGGIEYSNIFSLMHLVKVGKPIFHSKKPYKLEGSLADGSLRMLDPERYYFALYYIDVPNGINPLCAVYKGSFVFIKNQRIANGVRMWFYTSTREINNRDLDYSETLFYIYDVYQNNHKNLTSGLRLFNSDGDIAFESSSHPFSIDYVANFEYTEASYIFYKEVWNTRVNNRPQNNPAEVPFLTLYKNRRSNLYALNPNRKYATILNISQVKKVQEDAGNIYYFVESYTGTDGGVLAHFTLDVFMPLVGGYKSQWRHYYIGTSNFNNERLTISPDVLCVDVTNLPTSYN